MEQSVPSLAHLEASKQNQSKFCGNLKSISLKESGKREFTITLNEETKSKTGQIHRLILLLEEQTLGSMTFSMPKEVKNNVVLSWQEITFDCKITKWARTDKMTITGLLTSEALMAMNKVLGNWDKELEFFFEGRQQTIN